MKIFLTGRPGSGKTTVVKNFIEKFPGKVCGFLTPEIRESGKRTGFLLKLIPSGEELVFASTQKISSVKFGKYYLNLENLDKAIEKISANLRECEVVAIDEIGKMEMFSPKFKEFIRELLKKDINLLAVVHRAYAKEFEKYGEVIWVRESNREEVLNRLLSVYKSHAVQKNRC